MSRSGVCVRAALLLWCATATPAVASSGPADWFVPARPVATVLSPLAAGERVVARLPRPVVLDPRNHTSTATLTVPAGESRGGDTRWIVRIRVRAEVLDTAAAARRVTLSALVNDKAVHQVTVASRLDVRGRRTSVTEVGLLGGNQRSVVDGAVVDAVHENYAQLGSVRPGDNVLTLRLANDGVRLKTRMTVTAVELVATPHDERELELAVPAEPVVVRLGETMRFPVEVVRRGVRPDAPVTVEQRHDSAVVAVTPATTSHPTVGTRLRLEYSVRAVSLGETSVLYRLDSSYNHPGSVVRVRVVADGGKGRGWGIYAIAAGGLVAGAGYRLRRASHA